MTLSIDYDDDLRDQIAERAAQKIADKVDPNRIMGEFYDRLMTPAEICDKVLHCGRSTLDDYYMQQPGFPYTYKGSHIMYLPSQVRQWLIGHQQYA